MSKKDRGAAGHSGSALFLMEMICSVFFFVVCASVCILAFAKSDRMSRQARNRNQAVLAAESAAEVFRAEGPEGLVSRLSYVREDEDTCTAVVQDGRQQLSVTVELSDAGDGLTTAVIHVRSVPASDPPEDIFTLETRRYVRPQADS